MECVHDETRARSSAAPWEARFTSPSLTCPENDRREKMCDVVLDCVRRTPQMPVHPVVYRASCLDTGAVLLPIHPLHVPHGAEDTAKGWMQDR
mmetsp:Transcript_112081/g.327852  ORF Transcript_112081/g.327852 Transcript_112081/m.327852 type:complete len:93 (-) Transcript_112081:696-974(-)